MFEKLDLKKKMFFKDGREPIEYSHALTELSDLVELPLPLNPTSLEEKIKCAIRDEARALMNNKRDYLAHDIVLAFHKWVTNIHNDNLAPPPGNQWPNNIVYDIIIALRNSETGRPEDALFRFFLEGLNARKICKGQTPSLDFISTSFIYNQLDILSKMGPLSRECQTFYDNYHGINAYVNPQKQMESSMTKLKDSPLFGFLSAQNVFDYRRELNVDTGAKSYDLDLACSNGVKVSEQYKTANLSTDVQKMVQDVESTMKTILPLFDQIKSTHAARLDALWDAAPWLCRGIVALRIASTLDPEIIVNTDITAHPLIVEITQRCMKGDFPANARNQALAKLELTELFTQEILATEALEQKSALAL